MANAECRAAPVDASGSASERSERCVSPPGGGVGRPSLRDGCVGKGARTETVGRDSIFGPGWFLQRAGCRPRACLSKLQSSGAERHLAPQGVAAIRAIYDRGFRAAVRFVGWRRFAKGRSGPKKAGQCRDSKSRRPRPGVEAARFACRAAPRPRTNVSEGKAASREIAPRRVARAAASPRGRPAFSRFAR